METTDAAPGTKKILVIDDNRIVLTAMSFLLKAKGYSVLLAESGAETISILRKNKPDLILLDLDFPPDIGNIGGNLRDGFLILDWARRMCDAEKIPVIIVSSLDPEKYKERAMAAGIPIFFRKPVDKAKLLEAIQTTLGEKPEPHAA
ncbi:MAG TPA: response regulator [bacterium]|jgi:CheY-like chemotaxis protein|nr:response regulator [bacterium]